MSSLFILIPISLILGVVVLALLLWAGKRDQFGDSEGPKYRMLDDTSPLPTNKPINKRIHEPKDK